MNKNLYEDMLYSLPSEFNPVDFERRLKFFIDIQFCFNGYCEKYGEEIDAYLEAKEATAGETKH